MNIAGENELPCLTPLPTLNLKEVAVFLLTHTHTHTHTRSLLYQLIRIAITHLGKPAFIKDVKSL